MTRFHSFIAKVTMLSLVIGLVAVVEPAQAAQITGAKDTMSRLQISTLSNHEILFTSPTGVASGATIIVTFNSNFSVAAALDFEDIDLSHDSTPDGVCNTGDVETVLAAAPSGATVGVVRTSGTVITFTNGTTVLAAGSELCIEIGTNATSVVTGIEQVTNASTTSTASTKTVALSGTFGDTGTIALGITDDDQVAISAIVDPSLTFDLDTPAIGATCTDTTALTVNFSPSSVAVTTTDVETSGTSDDVERLCIDLATNADGGVTVTVLSLTSGALNSTSTGATITSADATMSAGTENWGACIDTGAAGLTVDANWETATCAADGNTNVVGNFSGATQTVMTASAPIVSGTTEMYFSMAISATTEAASDYTNTLTFIATGTF